MPAVHCAADNSLANRSRSRGVFYETARGDRRVSKLVDLHRSKRGEFRSFGRAKFQREISNRSGRHAARFSAGIGAQCSLKILKRLAN